MKFKVGDKIKGISNTYGVTNKGMYLGEVKEVGGWYIKILVLEHIDSTEIGKIYTAVYPEAKFEIVKSKNGKFFKKLPNNFTGTLEVENGFIVEKEILDDTEREYLNNVIKPFKDKVKCIRKDIVFLDDREFICIEIKRDPDVFLPYFKKNAMYKGMEANKEYTLKELGLDE